ncbi:MAG: tail fiber domain-containing protein [Acidobacteriota bacterium]|nr:tail fiber domain-containing protein [Acidobacteriota bacterium]
MKTIHLSSAIILLLLIFSKLAVAQSTDFTYQGKLIENGSAPTGNYDFEFRLFSLSTGGTPLDTQTNNNVLVTNGAFSVRLNFRGDMHFTGGDRFLEILVKPTGGATYTTLTPRQLITSAPYSFRSNKAGVADSALNSTQLGGIAAGQYVITSDSRLSDARPPTPGSGNYIQNSTIQQPTANFNITGNGTVGGTLSAGAVSGNGAGLTNLNATNIASGTLDSSRLPVVPVSKGGTGLTNPGTAGNYLRSNGTGGWTNLPIQPADVPDGSTFYIQNQTAQQSANFNISGSGTIGGNLTVNGTLTANLPSGDASYVQNRTTQQTSTNFNISGTGTANAFSATSQYNLGGVRFISRAGTLNTFVGDTAGVAISTGGGNAFFGVDAGKANSSGNSNTFLGAFSGQANTTASNNTFLGVSAGFANTIGTDNVFVGTNAGDSNINGSDNTFAGREAGQSNSSGNNNSFFGSNAGGANTIGGSNSFFGAGSGAANTGEANSFFGAGSGTNNTTGNSNTIIGAGANVASGSLTYATAIGAGAVVEASNNVVLGRFDDFVRIPGRLRVDQTIALGSLALTGNVPVCQNQSSGQLAFCSSSLRYKTHIRDFRGGLSLVKQLRPISFNWKNGGQDVGFGAEEVAEIEPLLTTYNEKGEIEGVKYAQITVVLVNAVKEQQTQIELLQQQIKKQQQQIEALKQFVCLSNNQPKNCK